MSVDELWMLHLEISDALLLLEQRRIKVKGLPGRQGAGLTLRSTQNTAILITSIARMRSIRFTPEPHTGTQ